MWKLKYQRSSVLSPFGYAIYNIAIYTLIIFLTWIQSNLRRSRLNDNINDFSSIYHDFYATFIHRVQPAHHISCNITSSASLICGMRNPNKFWC